jgi:septal ring factor EnvC (AmiA/AmiB activator)
MQTVFYILASVAAILLIVAVPILTIRALVLMARMEDTRRDLSALIAEAGLSLQHINRLLARTQESLDRLRHSMDRIEKVITYLQPAAAVGGIIAGARRAMSGRRQQTESSDLPENEGETS